jgi:hypothetical protein
METGLFSVRPALRLYREDPRPSHSQSYFMTGSLPPISLSWQHTPWESRKVFFSNWTLAVVVPAGLMTTFYCLRFETPSTWRSGPRIYIPQEQGDRVIRPSTGFPFCHLLWLTGLRWRYSTPPPLEKWQISWDLQERLRRDGTIVELSVESHPVKSRLGGWCEMHASLGVVSCYLRVGSSVELFKGGWEEMALQLSWQEFCMGGCDKRTWAWKAEVSPLLEAVAREWLLKI